MRMRIKSGWMFLACGFCLQGPFFASAQTVEGPVENPGMRVTVDAEGVHADDYPYDPASGRRNGDWRAVTPCPNETPPRMEVPYPAVGIVRPAGKVRVPAHPFRDGNPVVLDGDGGFAVKFDRVLSAYTALEISGGAVATSGGRTVADAKAPFVVGPGNHPFELVSSAK